MWWLTHRKRHCTSYSNFQLLHLKEKIITFANLKKEDKMKKNKSNSYTSVDMPVPDGNLHIIGHGVIIGEIS